jgi:hypothetical protein
MDGAEQLSWRYIGDKPALRLRRNERAGWIF